MQVATGPTAVRSLGRLAGFAVAAVVAAGAAIVPAGPAVAKPTLTPEQKAAAIVLPAVVYLEVNWEGWVRDRVTGSLLDSRSVTVAARCSGFAVSNDGFIVTAAHCLDPGVDGVAPEFFRQIAQRRVEAGLISASDQAAAIASMTSTAQITGGATGEPPVRAVYAQRGVAKAGLTSGDALPAQVVSFQPSAEGDIGLVKIEKSNQPIVTLADSSKLSVGTDVLAIGYPAATNQSDNSLEPSNGYGKISADRTVGTVPLYQTSVATTESMSGGPVADLNGDIVGLVSAGPATDATSYNFLAASSVIAKALVKAGVKNDLGKVDKDYRAGLAAYYDGRYTAAIEAFDQVLATVPSQAQAQQFRLEAVNRRNTEGDPVTPDSGEIVTRYRSPAILIAAIVVLLAGLILGGRWRARSHPTPPAAQPSRVYCTNCSTAAPPGATHCDTCHKEFTEA